MRPDRANGAGMIVLGLGIAASALLGPLVLGFLQPRVSPGAVSQQVGGELVSLVLVAPVALGAGVLWLARHRLAPLLAMGPPLYAIYTYSQFVVRPEYARYPGNSDHFFPFYLGLLLLSGALAQRAWRALAHTPLAEPSRPLRRAMAGLLLGLNGLFALAWTASIAAVLRGASPPGYAEAPTLFWVVRLVDLGAVIPITLVVSAGLLRHRRWATRAACALMGFQTLLIASVAGMAVLLTLRQDPARDPVLLVASLAATGGFGITYGRLLRLVRVPDPPERARCCARLWRAHLPVTLPHPYRRRRRAGDAGRSDPRRPASVCASGGSAVRSVARRVDQCRGR